jgi:hypothetical protein
MPAISYLNHVLGQDHRFVRKRMAASPWFRSVKGALRTIAGYEAMNMIRKGQVRCRPSRPDSRVYRRDLSQMTCLSPNNSANSLFGGGVEIPAQLFSIGAGAFVVRDPDAYSPFTGDDPLPSVSVLHLY